MTNSTKTRSISKLAPYLLALAAGLLLVAPQIVFRFSVPDGVFHGINLSETDQEAFYFARVHEVMEGRYGIRNAFTLDYKDKPILHLGGLEVVFGVFGGVTGLGIDDLMVLVKLVLGTLVFLALYRFTEQLTSNAWVAAAGASVVVFATDAVLRPWLFYERYLDLESARFLFYSRPIQPAGGSALLFGAMAVALFWSRERTLGTFALLTGMLAASFYVYLYTWTFLFAFLGMLVLVALWKRDYELARGTALAMAIAIALGSYLFYELARAAADPDYAATTARFGGVGNRYPVFGLVAPLCAGLALLVPAPARQRAVVLALGFTPLVVLNQQLLTGRTVHSGHYHWYVHEPLLLLFSLAIFHRVLSKTFVKGSRVAFAGIVLIAFGLGGVKQISAYDRWYEPYVERQPLGEVYTWLNENTEPDSVVLAEELEYLAGYTHNNSFLNLPWTLVPQQRLIEDYYVRKFFFGGEDAPLNGSIEEKREMAMHVYAGHYHEDCEFVEANRLDVSYPCYDDERLEPLYARYRSFDASTVLELTSTYGLEYVLAGRGNENALLARMPIVFESEEYVVYTWDTSTRSLER